MVRPTVVACPVPKCSVCVRAGQVGGVGTELQVCGVWRGAGCGYVCGGAGMLNVTRSNPTNHTNCVKGCGWGCGVWRSGGGSAESKEPVVCVQNVCV